MASSTGDSPGIFVHAIPGRLLPSSGRWSSIEIDFGLLRKPTISEDHIPSNYSKSYDYTLSITNKAHFKRFIYVCTALVIIVIASALLATLLPRKHKHTSIPSNLPLAISRALEFFDAQKSGVLPKNNPVRFRGDSGLRDGVSRQTDANLVGGFYDSGENVKFSFTTAYTISLLSWSVIEYHEKYAAIGELDHVKDVIKWGSDYLLSVYVQSNLLYSQVGSVDIYSNSENDFTCWERPEDMSYARNVSICDSSASDLSGEIIAALASASLVFSQEEYYSKKLIQASERLFLSATKNPKKQTSTATDACGGEARNFYNSSGYYDELVWGGTWLFFATGNFSYLEFATETFGKAEDEETDEDSGVFYWNNKLAANAVLLTRLWYLRDPGYPYDETLKLSSDMTNSLMCFYTNLIQKYIFSPGGLILLKPTKGAQLQLAANAAFLAKIFSDYLDTIRSPGGTCDDEIYFSVEQLQNFATKQVSYILGQNPSKMSYLVGFGDHFPQQVHHRAASIPWDGRRYSCKDGERWRLANSPNPNVLAGAMVAGPDRDDKFLDKRNWPQNTEPTISGNAGLVAALVALLDNQGPGSDVLDRDGIFAKIF